MERRYYTFSEATAFKRFFGINLFDYWEHPTYLGFDVIKFDEFVQTPDGKSTCDHVRDTYSRAAMDLISLLTRRT